jgi:hypothetical protein
VSVCSALNEVVITLVSMMYGIVLRKGIMIISPGPRIPTNLPRYNKTTRSQWLTILILSANSTRRIISAIIMAIICRGSILVLFLYNDDYSVQPKKGIGYGSSIPWYKVPRHGETTESTKNTYFCIGRVKQDIEPECHG